ncbi:hypothetical protein D9M71_584100 [compost metagenome]
MPFFCALSRKSLTSLSRLLSSPAATAQRWSRVSPRSKATRTLGKYTWFIASSLESTRVRSICPSSTMRSRSTTSTASDSSYSRPGYCFFSSASCSAWLLPLSTMIFLPTRPLALVGRARPLR